MVAVKPAAPVAVTKTTDPFGLATIWGAAEPGLSFAHRMERIQTVR